MSQSQLFSPRVAPSVSRVDLNLGDAGAGMAALPGGCFDLAIFDPAWSQYTQQAGQADPSKSYLVLSEEVIGAHLQDGVRLLKPGGRLVLWACWPLLVEALGGEGLPPWLDVPGLRWVTGGAWDKRGQLGVGYHWRGHSEPVLVGVKAGGAAGRAAIPLRNSFSSTKADHSAKPAGWMADWIRGWVPEGGRVLEPYAGLGSGAVATLLAGGGRHYVGWELDPERFGTARANVRRASLEAA